MMNWTAMIAPNCPDYFSKDAAKIAAALAKRINALTASQDELTALAEQARNAPITEIIDGAAIGKRYQELLLVELGIREDLIDWYRLWQIEKSKGSQAAGEAYENARAEAARGLEKLGYTEESMKGWNFVGAHPVVKYWLLEGEARRFASTDHAALNKTAIEYVEKELLGIRQRSMGVN